MKHNDPDDLKLEVSKFVNNVSSAALDYHFKIKEAYIEKIGNVASLNSATYSQQFSF